MLGAPKIQNGIIAAVNPENEALIGRVNYTEPAEITFDHLDTISLLPEADRFYKELGEKMYLACSGATFGVVAMHGVRQVANQPHLSVRHFLSVDTPHFPLDKVDYPLLRLTHNEGLDHLIDRRYPLWMASYDDLIAHAAPRALQGDPGEFDVVAGLDMSHGVSGGVVAREKDGFLHTYDIEFGRRVIGEAQMTSLAT